MTLSFTQTINGLPNYFIEKIWFGLYRFNKNYSVAECSEYRQAFNKKFGKEWDHWYWPIGGNGKIHTIRFDPHKRWRAGKLIHPVINNRTPNRFQFAPVINCKSVQRIDIKDVSHLVGTPSDNHIVLGYPVKDVVFNLAFQVLVDGISLNEKIVEELAVNDGFDSTADFFDYFKDGIEDGKIIHWTDKRY